MTELKLLKEIKEAAKLGQIIIIGSLFIHGLAKYFIGNKCEDMVLSKTNCFFSWQF